MESSLPKAASLLLGHTGDNLHSETHHAPRIQLFLQVVRKLQPWIKAQQIRVARKHMRERNRYSGKAKARARGIAAINSEFSDLPQPLVTRQGGWVCIDAPENFSLRHNYDEVVGFLWRFREEVAKLRHIKEARNLRSNRLRINFRTIKKLAPGAALVLAAEIDRWRRDFGFRPAPIEMEEWDPQVRERLMELGLFDLLDVAEKYRPAPHESISPTKMIRFLTETGAPGSACEALKQELEKVAGPVPARTYFHDGVSEAMANVGHHAYPPQKINPAVPWMTGRWWATGSYNSSDKSLRIIFYDQGVGIPATLPIKEAKNEKQKGLFDWILSELKRLKTTRFNDGQLIGAALMYPRSSTGEANRGNGLTDIRNFVENSRAGTLRIVSGRGEIAYERGGKLETQTHSARFTGTLIEWEVFRDVDGTKS